MVSVDGGGHLNTRHARRDELQHRHLRRRVLHRHAVRSQVEVRLATANVSLGGIVQMAIDNLPSFFQNRIRKKFALTEKKT